MQHQLVLFLDKILKACGRNGFYPVQPITRKREYVPSCESLEILAKLDEIQALENQLEALVNRREAILAKADKYESNDDKRSSLYVQAAGIFVREVKIKNKINKLYEEVSNGCI